MSDYSLIKSLQTEPKSTPLPKGHKYNKYEVVIEGETIIAHIPIKESETFQKSIDTITILDKYSFNKIMREVRGIRG